MTKTLVIILNHNLPEYTDWLYHSLVNFEKDIYELKVMDNGSNPDRVLPYTHIRLEENLFWGGALNMAFRLVLEDTIYDSLLFLNNDIELTGEVFVKGLRAELFNHDFAIVSPCIAGRAQPWKQMQNWGSKSTRTVRWIDNQAPLFHRKLIESIGQFDPVLFYGWGQELICMDVCESNEWKIGVCDHITMLHYGKQTILQNSLFNVEKDIHSSDTSTPVTWREFQNKAMESYVNYFIDHPIEGWTFDDLRAYGENYTYDPFCTR